MPFYLMIEMLTDWNTKNREFMDFPIKVRLDYDRFLIKKPTKENRPNPKIELGSGTNEIISYSHFR